MDWARLYHYAYREANVTKHCPDEGLKRRRRAQIAKIDSSDEPSIQKTQPASPDAEASASPDLASAICARFAPIGGIELELPPREPIRNPPNFD